ncbi:MAG TPA: Rieske 2Fe-2S domain-containing protein [Pyrinomonadaceae bacterium]|nr:Rieske 2Fe-2S domain-containing protein [Pyrinomonadaceae bacterium]
MIVGEHEQLTFPDGEPLEEQPKWRQDFPTDWPQDHYVARRDFTKFMVLISLAFTTGQFWLVLKNYLRKREGQLPPQEIATVEQVPIGGALPFAYPEAHDSCLLLRTGEKSFIAFSQKCTHLSCAVLPQPDQGRFYCPCHEGSFDLATGEPLAGPPQRPLPRISLEVRGGTIYALGVELRT